MQKIYIIFHYFHTNWPWEGGLSKIGKVKKFCIIFLKASLSLDSNIQRICRLLDASCLWSRLMVVQRLLNWESCTKYRCLVNTVNRDAALVTKCWVLIDNYWTLHFSGLKSCWSHSTIQLFSANLRSQYNNTTCSPKIHQSWSHTHKASNMKLLL